MLILAGVLGLLGFTFLRAVELDRAAYVGLICGAVLGGINILLGYKVTGRALEQGTAVAMRMILMGFFVRMPHEHQSKVERKCFPNHGRLPRSIDSCSLFPREEEVHSHVDPTHQ